MAEKRSKNNSGLSPEYDDLQNGNINDSGLSEDYYNKSESSDKSTTDSTDEITTTRNDEEQAVVEKYRDMAKIRDDFNTINPANFMLPTIGEMVQEDLMSEILQGFIDKGNIDDLEKGILDESFYTETPFSTSLGYHPDKGVFVLNARALLEEKDCWLLNEMDGDTTKFSLDDIDDGNQPFVFTNRQKYNSFKDYFKKLFGGNKLTLRHVGLNCPELPHFSVQAVPKHNKDWQIQEMTFKELKDIAKKNKKVTYLKHPTNSNRTKIVERKDTDKVKVLKCLDEKGRTIYKEIRDDIKSKPVTSNSNYEYHTIVFEDDSTAQGILDAYKCQDMVKETLGSATDILLVINANGLSLNKKSATTNMTFNSIYYLDDTIDFMLSEWKKSFGDIPQTNYSYHPYGSDIYGRALGAIYIKEEIKGESRWVNLNKKVLAKSEFSEANPSYTSSPELQAIGAGLSDVFKTWSYEKDNIEYLDSFNSLTEKSYQKRIQLHKELTGIDFTQSRDCALMIGDTMMLVPPESIRNVTQVFYERLPNMRSKGTMTKQIGQNEQMLEVTLYFYEDAGINGIPYKVETPSGETLTYHMNGFRSLLAQFKVTPYLPIENGYINDVLGIEAVCMENLYVQTVEGYPRLLKVVLTLKEFNYRTFMPDLPIDDNDPEDTSAISEMNPMFAKSFNWEIFRYYYQRSIMAGEDLKRMEYGSYDHNLQFYTNKNTLQPFDFCSPPGMGSKISFYIPDEIWLQNALQVKKNRDQSYYTDQAHVELSENTKKFCEELSTLLSNLNKINQPDSVFYNRISSLLGGKEINSSSVKVDIPIFSIFNKTEEETSQGIVKGVKRSNIAEANGEYSMIFVSEKDHNDWGQSLSKDKLKKDYILPIRNAFFDGINDARYMTGVILDEYIYWNKSQKRYDLCWDFNISLNTTSLSEADMTALKEALVKEISQSEMTITMDKIFKDNKLKVRYKMPFKAPGGTDLTDPLGGHVGTLVTGDPGNDGAITTTFALDSETPDYQALLSAKSIINNSDDDDINNDFDNGDISGNAHNKAIDFYIKDYKNPANMPFVPYLENVPVGIISSNLSNTFAEINLKAVEGVGPQFLGGTDSTIELQIMTDDLVVVSMLNNLPIMASATAKKFRRILPAWPLKIRSEFSGMMSISEVLIDTIEVDTVEGYPGVYSIGMRLTSVDRTQRQREALRRLDVQPFGGNVDVQSSNLAIKKYFAIESALSEAELYPDLDLPTLDDMAMLGWRFVKYTGDNRTYPDPDFYITYAYPYSSLIIKKSIKDIMSKQVLNPSEGDKNLQSFKFVDVLGADLTGKVESTFGVQITEEGGTAETYQDIIDRHKELVKTKAEESNWTNEQKQGVLDTQEEVDILNFLTMCDVGDGWEIKPGMKAPLCDYSTNDAIKSKEKNLYAQSIKEKRAKAIELINKILDGPLNYKDGEELEALSRNQYQTASEKAVNAIFIDNKYGQDLIKLLCPTLKIKRLKAVYGANSNMSPSEAADANDYDSIFNEKYFKKLNPLTYLAGFLFASGCALSGQEEYKSKATPNRWYPSHYSSVDYSNGEYNYAQDKGYEDVIMPYVEQERKEGSVKLAKTIEGAVSLGTTFGAWRIKKYNSVDIISQMMMREDKTVTYKSKYYDEIYRDKENKDKSSYQYINAGYLDPYYNLHAKKKDIIEKYNKSLCLSREANAEAFLRIVLTHLKKMILDGLIFSEIDVMLEDFSYFYNKFVQDNALPIIPTAGTQPVLHSDASFELSALGISQEEMSNLVLETQKSFERALCARLIYPFVAAVTENDPNIYNLFKSRDYNALDNLTGYVEGSEQSSEGNNKVYKFLTALAGINMTLFNENGNESNTSASQQLMNNMMKDVYIAASEDPRAYLLHSFYDMLVNDKRGRLVRAFPTYYVVFVDEGRKIGSWKLHDNFYNMNSISEIQVVKSRKIAADTCTITMNNMFNSYTTESDITTSQQYMDTYGLRDVFDSIFSPRAYFEKEKALRLRQNVPDRVQLQPGVRIHVRMGYSGDGSKLPIVFNGKIAEVEVNSVAQIVAQGDGHELMNPLNAFGEMEVTSLDPAQSMCTWFKDIRGSLAKGGETPRDLLAKLLTAKHGGWKKVANKAFDGRWFNDNPFGIMHFGDPKYDAIFDLGEPVQNLYEVADSTLIKGMNELGSSITAPKSTPIINTSLQDKTLWDILHLCANSGLGYIGAVRDFGFRSTIFLGKPNHYYAYQYTLVDNKVVEKRKPFQQFHYYDSYNDIIYNSIKASESQMRTNAVGIWQSSSPWWGREQATVGPIYLDMNIYPEYQKSMTVDTGLLADGNGGIDFPALTHLSEKWSMDANDDKVNKALAWRVTANTLRDSVKDMYQGDIAVIGDPSVKPHDRVSIYDTYEDMQGMFEVEAVIHTMSAHQGFTTSIMPDVIARHQDEMEPAAQGLLNTVASVLRVSVAGTIAHNMWVASVNNKLAVSLAKSNKLYGASKRLNDFAKNMGEVSGMTDYLESHPATKKLFENLNFVPSTENLQLNRFTYLLDDLAKGTLDTLDNSFDSFVRLFIQYNSFNADEFAETMLKSFNKDQFGMASKHTEESIKAAADAMKDEFNKINNGLNKSLKKVDVDKFILDIKDLNIIDEINPSTKKYINELGKITDANKGEVLSKLLADEDLVKIVKQGDRLKLNGVDDLFKGFKDIITNKKTGLANPSILKVLKGGDVIDDLLGVVIRAVKLNWASILLDVTIGLVTEIFVRNAKEMFTRWLQSIQAVDVYPLKKNGKPLIAGMNGHKGSVAMYPVNDGYNSIQGMILETVDSIRSIGAKNSFFKWGDWLTGTFVDMGVLESLSTEWRQDLGLPDPNNPDDGILINSEDFNQNVYNEISAGYANKANHAYSLMTKSRLTSYDTNGGTDATYKYYEIKGINPRNLITNEKIRNLYYLEKDDILQKAIADDKLIISHNKAYTHMATIQFEYGNERIPVVVNNKREIDTPLVQEEVIYILQKLVTDKSLKGKIHFKSGARFNDSRTWRNTGFSFILEYQGFDDRLGEALDKVQKETMYEGPKESSEKGSKKYNMFTYKKYDSTTDYDNGSEGSHGSRFVIIVYAPTQNQDRVKK